MKPSRRAFLHLATSAAALPAVVRGTWAQSYPSRPVRLVVGFAAGSAADIVARLIAQWLSERLGQQFLIENRPGAASNLATEAVVRAPADGYTLLLVTAANVISATLYEKLAFNVIRDIAPVGGWMRVPYIMEINPSAPAKTVIEFIDYAKDNPGKLAMASTGIGSGSHVVGEMFKMMVGVTMLHVPYRGGAAALTDLLGGQVHVMFDALPSSIEYARTGKLRPLAVTTAARSGALPEVPTLGDFVPGYEASGWIGLGAPRNTPVDIIDRLNKEMNAAFAHPSMKARIAGEGTPLEGSPADFAKFIAEETDKWGKVVKFAKIKAD